MPDEMVTYYVVDDRIDDCWEVEPRHTNYAEAHSELSHLEDLRARNSLEGVAWAWNIYRITRTGDHTLEIHKLKESDNG